MMNRSKELSKENHQLQSKIIELQSNISNLEEKLRGSTVG